MKILKENMKIIFLKITIDKWVDSLYNMGVDKERIDTMAKETKTQKIERMMRVYKCSYEEALQLILDDEATDRGVLHEWNLT